MAKQSGDEDFIGNPVNAFLLIKKTTKDLQAFVDTLNTKEQLKGDFMLETRIKTHISRFLLLRNGQKYQREVPASNQRRLQRSHPGYQSSRRHLPSNDT
jgi:hypothetical protein